MKTFPWTASVIVVKLICPNCNTEIEHEIDALPIPNMGCEHIYGSDNSEEYECECPECNATFTIIVYKGQCECSVEVRDENNEEIEIEDIEVLEYEGNDDGFAGEDE